MYALAFLAALLVDSIPVFAPPAWTILTVLIVKYRLNPWAVVALGAVGSTIGRSLLMLYIPRIEKRLLSRRSDANFKYLGGKLKGRFWPDFFFMLAYSLTPLSTTALFTAAGIAKLGPVPLLPAFFIGKFSSDAVMVYTGKYAAHASMNIWRTGLDWKSGLSAFAGLIVLGAVLFIDWRALLEHKKLRLHFRIWE